MSTFKVAGVSKFNGSVKVRFANDITRVKVLAKGGHTDINLIELPSAMTKGEVVTYLMTTPLAQTPEFKEAMDYSNEKYNGEATAKAEKSAAVKKPASVAKVNKAAKKAKPAVSMDTLKARATDATATAADASTEGQAS